MSDGDRWSQVDALLEQALDRDPVERSEFLRGACGGDASLRSEVERLLELASDTGDPLAHTTVPGRLFEEAAEELAAPAPGELEPGQRVGPYEVRGLLGEGGMGRVYRGWDPALGREVALKALAETFAGSPESLRRFQREAKLLATLNHPNIGAIYELLNVQGQRYLVLELVEGQTLEDRLAHGPLPLDETVRIVLQLVDALEEAHRKGVIHRDLKPTNVMLSRGRLKVLDFGLAKSEMRGDTESSSLHTTRSGVVLGTAAYMSPEQARGETVDRRTDIWAFGCLLFEMLSGERVFQGRSGPDILAAVLRDPIDFSPIPQATPPGLRRLVRHCLQKEAADRLQNIGDARLELADLPSQTTAPMRPGQRARRRGLSLGVAAPWLIAGLAIAGALAVLPFANQPAPRETRRLALLPGPGLRLPADYAPPFALSRDGRTVAFRAQRDGEAPRLFVRRLDSGATRELEGTEDAWQPFFSPDGEMLGFFADRKLKVVPTAGGRVRNLVEIGGNPRGATWSESGVILLSPSQTSGLLEVDARTGEAEPLTRVDASAQERSHRWPHALPGGVFALFAVQSEGASFDDARIEAVRLADGTRHVVASGGSHPVWSASGHLVFARQGRLLAAPFDPRSAARRGDATVVLEGVGYSPRNGGAQFSVADDGLLLYRPGPVTSLERLLAWVDADGRITPLATAPRRFSDPRVSPDGSRIAVRVGAGDTADLWVLDVPTGTLTQLTFDEPVHRPEWGPAPGEVTWASHGEGRWRIAAIDAGGDGPARTLFESAHRLYPGNWTGDGRQLVYQERRPQTGWDVRVQSFGPDGLPDAPSRALVARPANEERPRVSRDGRWLAYESDELDAVVQVYVRPFAGGAATRVTSDGARSPLWGEDGMLYSWRTGRDRLLGVRFPVGPERPRPRPVWPGAPADEAGELESRILAIGLDGGDVDAARGRFLVMMPPASETPGVQDVGLAAVLGWDEELAALAARR